MENVNLGQLQVTCSIYWITFTNIQQWTGALSFQTMYFILWISKWRKCNFKGIICQGNHSLPQMVIYEILSSNAASPNYSFFSRKIRQNTNLGFWEHLLQNLLPERFFNSCGLVSHPHPNCEKFAKFEIVLIMKACVHSYFVCRYKGFVLLFGLKICTDRGLICVTIWPEEMCSAVSWS